MKTKRTVSINAPVARVFDHISDPEKQKLWMDGLIRTEYTGNTDQTNQVGARFTQHLIKGHKKTVYEFRGEVLEYDKPKLYSYKLEGQDFTASIRYECEGDDARATLTTHTEMLFSGGFFARFIGRMAAHHDKQDTKKLIEILEKVPSSSSR